MKYSCNLKELEKLSRIELEDQASITTRFLMQEVETRKGQMTMIPLPYLPSELEGKVLIISVPELHETDKLVVLYMEKAND